MFLLNGDVNECHRGASSPPPTLQCCLQKSQRADFRQSSRAKLPFWERLNKCSCQKSLLNRAKRFFSIINSWRISRTFPRVSEHVSSSVFLTAVGSTEILQSLIYLDLCAGCTFPAVQIPTAAFHYWTPSCFPSAVFCLSEHPVKLADGSSFYSRWAEILVLRSDLSSRLLRVFILSCSAVWCFSDEGWEESEAAL